MGTSALPCTGNLTSDLLERDGQYLSHTGHRCFPVVAARGEGSYLIDVDGKRYLDFAMGIGVNNVGHCHPRVVAAAVEQVRRLIHCSAVTHHERNIELAEKLAEITPGRLASVFFNNSGGEAVDAAIKMARYVTGRPNVVSFTGAFHGRTLLATALTTAKSHYREGYEPLPSGIFQVSYPYCYRCPVGRRPESCRMECLDVFKLLFQHNVKPHSVAAIIIEPVLGEGGYVVPAGDYKGGMNYMKELRKICDENGIMLVFDEVQSGFGRTGKWFAADHFDVEPDIMIMAKGIASGFPMAGIISRKELMDKWTVGRHGSTYGGNPVACAAAMASIEVIEQERLLENATARGHYLMERLRALSAKFPFIGHVRGLGLMIGAEIVDAAGNPDGERLSGLQAQCARAGLLLLDCGSKDHIIRFIPPLNVSQNEVDECLSILEESLQSVS